MILRDVASTGSATPQDERIVHGLARVEEALSPSTPPAAALRINFGFAEVEMPSRSTGRLA
jgi:hypothetical protein